MIDLKRRAAGVEKTAEIVEHRKIPTPDGMLDVALTQQFIDRLRQHFGLLDVQPVEDDHVRMYVWGAVNAAVDKVEQGLKDDEQTGGVAS